jgi:hypothetical protein
MNVLLVPGALGIVPVAAQGGAARRQAHRRAHCPSIVGHALQSADRFTSSDYSRIRRRDACSPKRAVQVLTPATPLRAPAA